MKNLIHSFLPLSVTPVFALFFILSGCGIQASIDKKLKEVQKEISSVTELLSPFSLENSSCISIRKPKNKKNPIFYFCSSKNLEASNSLSHFSYFSGKAKALAIQDSSSILVAGNYGRNESELYPALLRQNKNSTEEIIFLENFPYTEQNKPLAKREFLFPAENSLKDSIQKSEIINMSIQDDEKILLSGNYDGQAIVMRLSKEGVPDKRFATEGFFDFSDTRVETHSNKESSLYNYKNARAITSNQSGDIFFVEESRNLNQNFKIQSEISESCKFYDFFCEKEAVNAKEKTVNQRFRVFKLNAKGLEVSLFQKTALKQAKNINDLFIVTTSKSLFPFRKDANNQKILVVGSVEKNNENGPNQFMAVWRLNEDGSLDKDFAENGLFIAEEPSLGRALFANRGKILITGYKTKKNSRQMAVWQLKSDGSLDKRFGVEGSFTHSEKSEAYDLVVSNLNFYKIFVTGYTQNQFLEKKELTIWSLNRNGNLELNPFPSILSISSPSLDSLEKEKISSHNRREIGHAIDIDSNNVIVVAGFSCLEDNDDSPCKARLWKIDPKLFNYEIKIKDIPAY